jgi:hypothetical protein
MKACLPFGVAVIVAIIITAAAAALLVAMPMRCVLAVANTSRQLPALLHCMAAEACLWVREDEGRGRRAGPPAQCTLCRD